jgi:hypothetical protein
MASGGVGCDVEFEKRGGLVLDARILDSMVAVVAFAVFHARRDYRGILLVTVRRARESNARNGPRGAFVVAHARVARGHRVGVLALCLVGVFIGTAFTVVGRVSSSEESDENDGLNHNDNLRAGKQERQHETSSFARYVQDMAARFLVCFE